MQSAVLLICFLTLFSNEQLLEAFAQREEARRIASSSLAEIEKSMALRPNPFLIYYSAKKYEDRGDVEMAKERYRRTLETVNLPSAVVLFDEAEGESEFGRDLYEKIKNIKLDSGALRIPFLAHHFLYRGLLRVRQGLDPERSLKLSVEMDPVQISPRLALIAYYLRRVNPLLYNELVGLFYSFRDFSNQYALLINFYLVTSTVVTVSLFFCLIGLFIRHARSIYHTILSFLPARIPYYLRLAIGALIILTASLLGLGSLWFWVAVALLLILFCNLKEKTLLAGAAILLLMAPIFSAFEQKALEVGDAFLLYNTQVFPYNATFLDSLYAIKAERPSYSVLYSIGMLEKKRGNFDAAEQAYMEALKENPESSAVYNNLGNVLFSMGKVEDAVESYEKAIEKKRNLASTHYNLSQAHLRLMDFDKYTKEIEIANELDFDLITEFINNSSEHPNRTLIDERLPRNVLWREVLFSQAERPISPILQLGNSRLVLAGSVLMAFLILMGRAFKLNQNRCSVCSAPVCTKCSTLIEQDRVCGSCASKLKLTKSPGIQQKIAQRIKQRKSRLKKVAGSFLSVLPGMGHIYVGAVYKGSFLLLISMYVAVGIIHSGVPYRPEIFLFDPSMSRSILGVSFLVLIGLAVIDILKSEMAV